MSLVWMTVKGQARWKQPPPETLVLHPADGSHRETVRRYAAALPHEASEPVHQVHPQVWVCVLNGGIGERVRSFKSTRDPTEKGQGRGTKTFPCGQKGSGCTPPNWVAPSGQCTSTELRCPFRFELVKGLLPEEYHKVLVNIRKAEARAKRHRALSQEEEEEEEEEEEPAQGKGDR